MKSNKISSNELKNNEEEIKSFESLKDLPRPLIFALTGDLSEDIIDKIASFPFCGMFDKISLH